MFESGGDSTWMGMARSEILEVLNTGLYRTEVDGATANAFEQGIRSVPNFICPSAKGFSGALPYGALSALWMPRLKRNNQ